MTGNPFDHMGTPDAEALVTRQQAERVLQLPHDAAHECAADADECPEASAVAQALADAIQGDIGAALTVVELDEDAL